MSKLEIWANMPVKDVRKTRSFFKQLGFTSNEDHDNEDLASFKFSEGNFVIHFFKQDLFYKSTGENKVQPTHAMEIMFTIAANSNQAVDEWKEKILKAGGTIITEPEEIPEGYNLVFKDLDEHHWNVFYHNPKASK